MVKLDAMRMTVATAVRLLRGHTGRRPWLVRRSQREVGGEQSLKNISSDAASNDDAHAER